MHIFRILVFILYCAIHLNGKQVIQLNTTDSTLIKQNLDSLIKHSKNLTTEYRLISYQLNPDSATYFQHSEYKQPDTLFAVSHDPIKKKTLDQIISPLRLVDIGKDIKPALNKIRNHYYFLTKTPDYQLGILNKDQLGLFINIRPEFQSHFSGLVGAVQNIDKSWNLTGEMDFHLENIWQTAGEINIYWQKLDSASQTLRIQMYEPHPFGWMLGTDLSYSYEIFDGLFTDTKTNVAWQIPGFTFGSLYLGYVSGKITPSSKGELGGYLPSRFQGLSVSFNHDSHNRRFLPNQGSKLDLGTDIGTQDDVVYIQAEIEADHYFSLSENWNIVTSLWGKIINLDHGNVPEPRKVRFGGINRLRGYRDQEFSADAVSIPTLALHYLPSMYWRTEFFIDMALIKALDHIPIGLGLGFSQLTDEAVIQVQYALSKGNNLLGGKLHISWISRL